MYREEDEEIQDPEEETEEMDPMDDPGEGGWGHHHHEGGMGWGKGMMGKGMMGGRMGMWCPMMLAFMAGRRMSMMRGGMGMPGMMGGGMMGHMGMMGGGMGKGMASGMAPWRHFVSIEEKIAKLEEYKKQLQMEEKGVDEKIDAIRRGGHPMPPPPPPGAPMPPRP